MGELIVRFLNFKNPIYWIYFDILIAALSLSFSLLEVAARFTLEERVNNVKNYYVNDNAADAEFWKSPTYFREVIVEFIWSQRVNNTSSQDIIRPYFFDVTVTGDSYLDMLQKSFCHRWLSKQVRSTFNKIERCHIIHSQCVDGWMTIFLACESDESSHLTSLHATIFWEVLKDRGYSVAILRETLQRNSKRHHGDGHSIMPKGVPILPVSKWAKRAVSILITTIEALLEFMVVIHRLALVTFLVVF